MRHLPALVAVFLLAACGGNATDDTPDQPTTGATKTSGETETKPAPKAAAKPKPPEKPPVVATTWRGEGTELEFSAWKMGCSGCESTVHKRIGGIDGVENVKADLASATVKVSLTDAAKRDAIIEQITKVMESPESGRKFEIVRADAK